MFTASLKGEVSWPMAMIHMHHIPVCLLFSSSSRVIFSRLLFASAIVLLPYIAFWVGEDWRRCMGGSIYGLSLFVWERFFSLHCFGVRVLFLFLVVFFVRDKGEHSHNGALAGLLKPLNSRSIHPTWTKSLQFRLVQLYKQQNETPVTKLVLSLKTPLKILHLL